MSLGLAGCFSPIESTSTTSTVPSTTAASTTTTAVVTHPLLPIATDTLHLLANPDFTPNKPTQASDIVVPILSAQQLAAQGTQVVNSDWNFTLPKDISILKANLTLWVDVEGAVVGDPLPTANGCFWGVNIDIKDNLQAQATTKGCAVEPLQVPNGIRAINIPLPLAQGPFTKGTTFIVQLTSNAFVQPPGSMVNLLTGSIVHDSTITVDGLQIPLNPASLLAGAMPQAAGT